MEKLPNILVLMVDELTQFYLILKVKTPTYQVA